MTSVQSVLHFFLFFYFFFPFLSWEKGSDYLWGVFMEQHNNFLACQKKGIGKDQVVCVLSPTSHCTSTNITLPRHLSSPSPLLFLFLIPSLLLLLFYIHHCTIHWLSLFFPSSNGRKGRSENKRRQKRYRSAPICFFFPRKGSLFFSPPQGKKKPLDISFRIQKICVVGGVRLCRLDFL